MTCRIGVPCPKPVFPVWLPGLPCAIWWPPLLAGQFGAPPIDPIVKNGPVLPGPAAMEVPAIA